LDVTQQLAVTLDLLDHLPKQGKPVGAFLRKIIPFFFRAYRQKGQESIHLHDVVTLIAALHPELFQTTEMAGDVETSGNLTTGATVFDRRLTPVWRPNMEVATAIDVSAVTDCLIRGLSEIG